MALSEVWVASVRVGVEWVGQVQVVKCVFGRRVGVFWSRSKGGGVVDQ